MTFRDGTVDLASSVIGGQFLGADERKASLHGTFTVTGDAVSMQFDEADLIHC